MKKILLIILFSIIPFIVYADCDYNKNQQNLEYAKNISYDNSYSKSTGRFTITVFNILNNMYVKYGTNTYRPNADGEVILENVKQGESVLLYVYADDGCSELRIFSIVEPYYNPYYNSEKCSPYKGKFVLCSSEFTSSYVNEGMIDEAIEVYNKSFNGDTNENDENKKEESFYNKLIDFGLNWGIKIVLFIVTVIVSSAFYNSKLRKIKHGV